MIYDTKEIHLYWKSPSDAKMVDFMDSIDELKESLFFPSMNY